MARLRVLAFALALSSAVPGAAEPGARTNAEASSLAARWGGDAPIHLERRGFSFPVIDYVEPTGTRQLKRGIVAGQTIAPNTLVGVGFFETAPRTRQAVGEPPASTLKRPRRSVAIGLSIGF